MIILFPAGEEKAMETMDIRFEKDSIEIEGWLGTDRVTVKILNIEITDHEIEIPAEEERLSDIERILAEKKRLLGKAILLPKDDEAEERVRVKARPEISKEAAKYVGMPSFNVPVPFRPTKIKSRDDRLRALRERIVQIYEDV